MASVSFSSSDRIHVSDLRSMTVIGSLGKPLGSRLVIAGALPTKLLMLANPLDVLEIDGRVITNTVIIEIRGRVNIGRGTHYKLEGYESAGFEGPPMWLNPEVQQPFQLRSFFFVTKVIEPKLQ
jgi:hypothetical protein